MNALHDAAMAAKRFHDAALAYLDRPEERERAWHKTDMETELIAALYKAEILVRYEEPWP